ncbi:MAG: hypothetical protein ACAH27_17570 [Xanthobacteraceae bacterium]
MTLRQEASVGSSTWPPCDGARRHPYGGQGKRDRLTGVDDVDASAFSPRLIEGSTPTTDVLAAKTAMAPLLFRMRGFILLWHPRTRI